MSIDVESTILANGRGVNPPLADLYVYDEMRYLVGAQSSQTHWAETHDRPAQERVLSSAGFSRSCFSSSTAAAHGVITVSILLRVVQTKLLPSQKPVASESVIYALSKEVDESPLKSYHQLRRNSPNSQPKVQSATIVNRSGTEISSSLLPIVN